MKLILIICLPFLFISFLSLGLMFVFMRWIEQLLTHNKYIKTTRRKIGDGVEFCLSKMEEIR